MPSAPVAALAAFPAGPQLSAALAELDLASLSGFDTVLVLKARNRQSNHERGLLVATVAEVMRRKDPDYGVHDMDSWDEVGMHEIRAALMLTRRSANSLCGLARDLAVRLPTVLAAMTDGLLDQARARVFSSWTAELADPHAHALVGRLLPIAPTLTTAQLIDAIQRAAIDLDPDWARRRYERAITARRVIGVLGHDGTASLTGEPVTDQVAPPRPARRDGPLPQATRPPRPHRPHPHRHLPRPARRHLPGLTETQLLRHLIATVPPHPTPPTIATKPPTPTPAAGARTPPNLTPPRLTSAGQTRARKTQARKTQARKTQAGIRRPASRTRARQTR